ncbi:hypothetical protein ACS0TY_007068 [Phlomoides rotata]
MDDITKAGFGGLLHLHINRCAHPRMLSWLVNNFNYSSRMFDVDNIRSFVITADDVHDVFMLPRNPSVPVVLYARGEESPILDRLKSDYTIFSGASFACLESALKEKFSDGGDDFVKLFILYALLSFLAPTPNRQVITRYVKSLEVVEDIPKFDWCSFVLERLCDSIKLYKTGVSKVFCGCVLFHQIVYFHRLKWQGVSSPSNIPLIQHWTMKKLSDRCNQEIEVGKYGSGELVLNVYPVSLDGFVRGDVRDNVPQEGTVVAAGCKEGVAADAATNNVCEEGDAAGKNVSKDDYAANKGSKDDIGLQGRCKDLHEFFTSLKKDAKVKNAGVDCESQFWMIKEPVGYLSPFMIFSNRYLSNMDQTHKEIVDLCFCDLDNDSFSM